MRDPRDERRPCAIDERFASGVRLAARVRRSAPSRAWASWVSAVASVSCRPSATSWGECSRCLRGCRPVSACRYRRPIGSATQVRETKRSVAVSSSMWRRPHPRDAVPCANPPPRGTASILRPSRHDRARPGHARTALVRRPRDRGRQAAQAQLRPNAALIVGWFRYQRMIAATAIEMMLPLSDPIRSPEATAVTAIQTRFASCRMTPRGQPQGCNVHAP